MFLMQPVTCVYHTCIKRATSCFRDCVRSAGEISGSLYWQWLDLHVSVEPLYTVLSLHTLVCSTSSYEIIRSLWATGLEWLDKSNRTNTATHQWHDIVRWSIWALPAACHCPDHPPCAVWAACFSHEDTIKDSTSAWKRDFVSPDRDVSKHISRPRLYVPVPAFGFITFQPSRGRKYKPL
jgi:hypothetical protein